jgi:glycosyltransferase involved in cell wall biosynthesis
MPLKIVGDGPDKKRLKKMAKENIEFVGEVASDKDLARYYSEALAFIFPQEEDFGIVALEAMASGKPIIAFNKGGALETVIEGKTGIFFKEQNVKALEEAIKKFDAKNFDSKTIRDHALEFDKEKFKEKIKKFVEAEWRIFQKENKL